MQLKNGGKHVVNVTHYSLKFMEKPLKKPALTEILDTKGAVFAFLSRLWILL